MGTFEAAAVVAVALLPGALYVWGFERQVGRWGIGLSDRLLRFFGTSALAHALTAPLTYSFWTRYVTVGLEGPLPAWAWLVPIAYVLAPFAAGSVVGFGVTKGWSWSTALTGPNPAPRAWDHFFANDPDGWIRLRLKSGTWIAGLYTTRESALRSYASGYPEAQELLLSDTLAVDPASGEFHLGNGVPVRRGITLLIRWDEVVFLEFGKMGELR